MLSRDVNRKPEIRFYFLGNWFSNFVVVVIFVKEITKSQIKLIHTFV